MTEAEVDDLDRVGVEGSCRGVREGVEGAGESRVTLFRLGVVRDGVVVLDAPLVSLFNLDGVFGTVDDADEDPLAALLGREMLFWLVAL